MGKLFKFSAVTTAALLMLASAANGSAWDFPSPSSVPNGSTLVGVNEPNSFDVWSNWSFREFQKGFLEGQSFLCPNGIDDKNCDPNKGNVLAESILSVCESASDENCVEGLRIAISGSPEVSAEFTRSVSAPNFSAPNQGAVPAGKISLWSVPGVPHAGGSDNYSVIVKLKQIYDRQLGRFKAIGLSANVSGFTQRSGGEEPLHEEQLVNGVSKVFTKHDPACIWAETGACGLPEDFPKDARVELTLRFSNEVTGWFRGRMTDPEFKVEPFSGRSNRWVVSAAPVDVPRISIYAKAENTPQNVVDILNQTGGKNPFAPLFTGNAIKDFFANEGERLFTVLEGLRSAAGDSAAGVSSLWNFTTIETQQNSKCFQDKSKVLGVVTTNASAYKGDPPEFSDGYLNYKVAGMHFGPDGLTPNLGTYDLLIASDIARCLYGFTNAPVSATVTVVGTGDQNIASTIVSEKDGWLKLAAYGFTFSEKEIQVKLSQPFTKTLTKFSGSKKTLTDKQKQEIYQIVAKGKNNETFACTATYLNAKSKSLALARAKAVCNFAKSMDPNHSFVATAKKTSSKTFDSKVIVASR